MKNKLRSLTALLAVVLCASVFSIPAYAQSSEPQTEQAAEETAEPEQATPNPFTPKGTGTVLDNATSEDEKEFYTIVTPDENVFYLVIDKQRDADNVYFLNAVTESDLMALAEKDGDTTTAQPVEPEPQPTVTPQPEEPVTEEPKEPEQPQTQGTSPLMMVLIGVAVLAVGGLGYIFLGLKEGYSATKTMKRSINSRFPHSVCGFSSDWAMMTFKPRPYNTR